MVSTTEVASGWRTSSDPGNAGHRPDSGHGYTPPMSSVARRTSSTFRPSPAERDCIRAVAYPRIGAWSSDAHRPDSGHGASLGQASDLRDGTPAKDHVAAIAGGVAQHGLKVIRRRPRRRGDEPSNGPGTPASRSPRPRPRAKVNGIYDSAAPASPSAPTFLSLRSAAPEAARATPGQMETSEVRTTWARYMS